AHAAHRRRALRLEDHGGLREAGLRRHRLRAGAVPDRSRGGLRPRPCRQRLCTRRRRATRLRSRATRNTLAAARRCGGERRRRDLPRSRPRRVGLLAPPPWLELLSSPLGGARTPTLLALRCEAGCRERTGSPRTRIAMARAASLPPHPQQLVDRGARDRVVARPRAAVDVLRDRPTPIGRNEVRVERTQELAPALRDEEPVQRGERGLVAVADRDAQPL